MSVELPPGPRSRLQTTVAMGRDYVGAFRRWHRRYGDVFTLRDLGGNTMVVLADPELVRELLSVSDPEQFGTNTPESLDVLVGRNSLLMHGGAAHQRARKRLQAPVCRRAIAAWAPVIADATRRAFASVAIDEPFFALDHARDFALDVIVRLVFGASGDEGRELAEAVKVMMSRVRPSFLLTRLTQRSLLGLSAYARYRPASDRLDELLGAHIQRLRGAAGGAPTVLSSLLDERDEHGRPLPDEVIQDNLRTMLIGGHETTTNALAWTLYYVHRSPELRASLRAELRGGAGSVVDAGLRSALLRACIDETLRLRPVAGAVYRRLARPLRLGPWELPAGVIVSPAIALLHHHEAHWAAPERFDPARFLAGRPSPHLYMPFGGGTHRCLGGAFARFEINIALSILVHELELELDEPGEVPWVQRGLPLGPGRGIRMIRRPLEAERAPASAA